MMMKRGIIALVLLLLLISNKVNSQETSALLDLSQASVIQNVDPDTLLQTKSKESELNKLPDIRTQFEKQNSTYSVPVRPDSALLRFVKKDDLKISEEALYWAHLVRDASERFSENVTFQDTIIVNPIFMPLLFEGKILPDNLTFYNFDQLTPRNSYSKYYKADSIFKDEYRIRKIEKLALDYVERNKPEYFRYTVNDLPKDVIKSNKIQITEKLLSVANEANFDDTKAPAKFIPERRYWTSNFESAFQFSQNHISANWNGGGTSNLNLYTRNYFRYNYNKDKVQLTNEVELNLKFYNAPKDTLHDYKIGTDVMRIHSNLGYEAFKKWYYTFDAEFRTQILTNYAENSTKKMAAFLSPFTFNFGVGMKYSLNKSFKDKHKNLYLAVNLAPVSFNYLHSITDNIDLARHGFQNNKTTLSKFGSTARADFNFNISRNTSWTSRFYYFTSYDQVVGEFENTLTLALNRFFSTKINFNLRYDDGVTKKKDVNSYFQLNELFSFGFNYRW